MKTLCDQHWPPLLTPVAGPSRAPKRRDGCSVSSTGGVGPTAGVVRLYLNCHRDAPWPARASCACAPSARAPAEASGDASLPVRAATTASVTLRMKPREHRRLRRRAATRVSIEAVVAPMGADTSRAAAASDPPLSRPPSPASRFASRHGREELTGIEADDYQPLRLCSASVWPIQVAEARTLIALPVWNEVDASPRAAARVAARLEKRLTRFALQYEHFQARWYRRSHAAGGQVER
jgi:hypothetical protein